MDQRITDNANKYKDLAVQLAGMNIEQSIEDDIPQNVQAALLRLYHAKAFEVEIEKCEDLLDEDTDAETVGAVTEASGAIDEAADSAFRAVEDYISKDDEFAERVEGITVSTETEGLLGSLLKLYKCEEIIRNAYKCSMEFPLYGVPTSLTGMPQESGVAIDAEEEIRKRLGVDIYELLELRQNLVKEIADSIEGKSGI